MAFNLGAFASGLVKGGIGTYVTLQELEEKKKEREMREAADRRQAIEFAELFSCDFSSLTILCKSLTSLLLLFRDLLAVFRLIVK